MLHNGWLQLCTGRLPRRRIHFRNLCTHFLNGLPESDAQLPLHSRMEVSKTNSCASPTCTPKSVYTFFNIFKMRGVCQRTKITPASCRKKCGAGMGQHLARNKIWQRYSVRIVKFSPKKVSRDCSIVMQWWFKICVPSGFTAVPNEIKPLQTRWNIDSCRQKSTQTIFVTFSNVVTICAGIATSHTRIDRRPTELPKELCEESKKALLL